jgi:hypothetical protein
MVLLYDSQRLVYPHNIAFGARAQFLFTTGSTSDVHSDFK